MRRQLGGEAADLPGHDVAQPADHAGDQRHDEQHADDARHAQPIEPRDERAQQERDEGGQHQRHEHGLPQIERGADDGKADQPHCKERRHRPVALGRTGHGHPCADCTSNGIRSRMPPRTSRSQNTARIALSLLSHRGSKLRAMRVLQRLHAVAPPLPGFARGCAILATRRRPERNPRSGTTFAGSGHERRHRQSRQSRGDCAL